MLQNYLLIALRQFWKQKLFSLINLVGLSLGLACSLLVYLWVQHQLHYDQFQVKQERLFLVLADWYYSDGRREISIATPANLAIELEQNIPGIINTTRLVGAWSADNVLRVDDTTIKQTGIYADSTFFDLFTFPLLRGNPAQALKDPHSIVINAETARTLFGSTEALGETITLSDKEGDRQYVVTGILADLPAHNSLPFDFVLPYPEFEQRHEWMKQWGSNAVMTLVELADPAQITSISDQIRPMITSSQEDLHYDLELLPYAELHLQAPIAANVPSIFKLGSIQYVYLFSAIALLVLLTACINFVNLTTARASQ